MPRASAPESHERVVDALSNRTGCVFGSIARRVTALKRGPVVPPDPLFSAACAAAGCSNDGAINAPEAAIQLPRFDTACLKRLQNLPEGPAIIPLIEQAPDRLPPTVLSWQVAPRRSGPQNPQNPIHDLSPVRWRSAPSPPAALPPRYPLGNRVPLLIAQLSSPHRCTTVLVAVPR